jgi:hypothetical protein
LENKEILRNWFTAIWRVIAQKYGASAGGLRQVLGLRSYETARTWRHKIVLHKIRKAMVIQSRTKRSGEVEIDERYIGGASKGGKTGSGSGNKTLVAVTAEIKGRKPGHIRLAVIKDASSGPLTRFITENIEQGKAAKSSRMTGKAFRGLNQKDMSARFIDSPQPPAKMKCCPMSVW